MTRFSTWQPPIFNKQNMTQWHWVCQHRDKFKLSANTDIGAFTYINAKFGVTIEENVQIGSHCALYSHNTIDQTQGLIVIKTGAKIGSHSPATKATIFENSLGVIKKIGGRRLLNQSL